MIQIGDIQFDPDRSTLRAEDGSEITLRNQCMEVLHVLAERPGETCSKDDIIASVWESVNVTDDSLVQCISNIRKAIGDRKHDILQTVPKVGYRLAPGQPQPASAPHEGHWRLADPNTPAIAVLPFEDLTGQDRWNRIGRGLATDIANELARNHWLYVTAPESTWQITAAPEQAGRELNVRFVLAGTIQAQGEQLRVSSNLTDAATGAILWSDRWTAHQDDLFDIQDRIIARIGASLTSTYSGVIGQTELRRAGSKPPASLSAYEHYLIGVELKHTFITENYRKAIEHLQTAVDLDPEYARAWSMLSLVQLFLYHVEEGTEQVELYNASVASQARAWQLDPDDPEILLETAKFAGREGDGARAKHLARKAIEMAPSNADTLLIVGWTSPETGITGPEPLQWVRRAFELNPMAPPWYQVGLGVAAFQSGNFDLSAETFRSAPPHIYTLAFLPMAEAMRDNNPAARSAAADLQRQMPGFTFDRLFAASLEAVPDKRHLFKAARLSGIPITAADLEAPAMPVAGPDADPG